MPWASCQIRKMTGCACTGNAGNVFPRHRLQWKPLVSDPVMHPGTCVTYVPWCMTGLQIRGGGENVPGIPGVCVTHHFAYLVRGPLLKKLYCGPTLLFSGCCNIEYTPENFVNSNIVYFRFTLLRFQVSICSKIEHETHHFTVLEIGTVWWVT